MDGLGGASGAPQGAPGKAGTTAGELQAALNNMVVQLLNEQVRKTCFDKCFPSAKFGEQLAKGEQICLAKCMDRMYEAHAIVMKASTEMAQNLASSPDGLGGGDADFAPGAGRLQ